MKNRLLFLVLLFTASLNAQNYSYLLDKKFANSDDLLGYNFVPSMKEIPGQDKEELGPNEYSFGITRNNLYVSGARIKGVYSVNNINPTEYGFKLTLMNARDPRQQGHLKVIIYKGRYVDALVFKKTKDEAETIFFLPEKPKHIAEKDEAYFTDRFEVTIEHKDSLWNKQVQPFFSVLPMKGNQHQRLQYADSTSINFVETIEIIEKIKKKKKGKKNKNKIEETEEEITTTVEATSEEETIIADEEIASEIAEAEAVEKKIKIIKEYFIDLKLMQTEKDGSEVVKTFRHKVKKWKEREDTSAKGDASERFQIELETNKGMIYVYLTPKRTISSIEIGEERYLMMGH